MADEQDLERLINWYDLRSRMEAAEELMPPSTFLTRTFFPSAQTFATTSVDLDLRKGTRRASAYVLRTEEGPTYEKQGYESNTFTPPYLKPKKVFTPSDLRSRAPGGSLWVDGSASLAPQVNEFIAREISEMSEDMIDRNIEIQCQQALFDAKVVAYGEDGDIKATVNYDRDGALNIPIGTPWTSATAKITEQSTEARQLINKLSGKHATFALCGKEATKAFLSNKALQDSLSKDWSTRGQLAYDFRGDGAFWLGFADGMDYWSYEAYFIDPVDNVQKFLIPDKKVLYASLEARTSVSYGALELFDQPMGERALDMTIQDTDPKAMIAQVHSAPLAITHHPNAYAVKQVVA